MPSSIMSETKTANDTRNQTQIGSDKVASPSDPASPAKQGCATSFLNQEKNELDKVCGSVPPDPKEEYVQGEREKESGGEA
jgi:hypothetical protein